MSYYGNINNVYLTKDTMSVIILWLPEIYWYKLRLNTKLVLLIKQQYKDLSVENLARGGHIESLGNRGVRFNDICQSGDVRVVKRFMYGKHVHCFWGTDKTEPSNQLIAIVKKNQLDNCFDTQLFDYMKDLNILFSRSEIFKWADCGLAGACKSGNIELVLFLLQHFLCQKVPDNFPFSEIVNIYPLEFGLLEAVNRDNLDIVKLMLNWGANEVNLA